EAAIWIKDERVQNLISKFASDDSPALRKRFFETLQKNNISDTRAVIPKMASSDPDEDVRLHAVEILKNRKNRQYISLFYKGLSEPNPDLRRISLEALFYFGDKPGAKSVSDQLSKESVTSIKYRLIDLLVDLGNHGGGSGILNILYSDPDPKLRSRAAEAMGKLSFNPGAQELKNIFDKEVVTDVKLSLLKALADLKDKSTISALLAFAVNKKEQMPLRLQAVETIRVINDPDCLPSLFDAYVFEKSLEVKAGMERAIKEILAAKFLK
ncbi:hypothetical protein CH373_18210, partial [Leptospira perolatii]